MDYPPLITRKAASQMTGLSPRYFDKLRIKGVLRTYRTIGGQHRFYRDDILSNFILNKNDHGQLQVQHADQRPTGGGE